MSNNIYNILNTFNKLNESAKPAVGQPKTKTLLESSMEQVLAEKFNGFKEEKTEEASYSAKKARAGKDIGKPGKEFAKIAKSAAERYGSKERGEKVAGSVLAKLRAKAEESKDPFANVDPRVEKPTIKGTDKKAKSAYYPPAKPPVKKLEKPIDETSQAYKDAMDAHRAASTDHRIDVARSKMAQRAAQPKTLGQHIKKTIGEPIAKLAKGDIKGALGEKAPPGAKAERMVKHIKKAYAADGKLTPKEKSIAYATAWKAHNKGQIEEGQYEDKKLYVVDTQTNKIVDEFDRYHEIPLRLMGYDGAHKIMTGAELNGKEEMAEGFPTVADARKKAEKEKGTGKFEKKKTDKGTQYTRKYNKETGESDEEEKMKKKEKTNESHATINKMVDNLFEGTVEQTPTGLIHRATDKYGAGEEVSPLSYEQDQLKQHLGNHLFSKLEKAMKLGDDIPDDLYDNLYEYYLDEMPYGTAKARTGDPMIWVREKINTVFPELDEARVVPRGSAFASQDAMALNPDFAPVKKPEGVLSRAGRAVVGGIGKAASGINKAIGHGSDEELLQQLATKRTMEEEALNDMMKLAGMSESKKAKPDFLDVDKDGNEKESFKKAVKDKEKVDECNMGLGGGYGAEQEGTMNISTNMSSDGSKNVTITASGNKADELSQMLKLAGMGGVASEPESESEPEGVATVEIGANNETKMPEEYEASPSPSYEDEEMDEGNAFTGALAKAKADGVQPGEKMTVGGKEYPVKEEDMEEGNAFTGALAKAKADGVQPGEKMTVGGKEYPVKEAGEEEVDEDARYEASTTPEEHAFPTQTLTKGGDGDVAGQEKKMNPTKPTWKNGDNAMSESISLKLMKEYESIKVKK